MRFLIAVLFLVNLIGIARGQGVKPTQLQELGIDSILVGSASVPGNNGNTKRSLNDLPYLVRNDGTFDDLDDVNLLEGNHLAVNHPSAPDTRFPFSSNRGNPTYGFDLGVSQIGDLYVRRAITSGATTTGTFNRYFHTGRVGAGSGIDADLVRGSVGYSVAVPPPYPWTELNGDIYRSSKAGMFTTTPLESFHIAVGNLRFTGLSADGSNGSIGFGPDATPLATIYYDALSTTLTNRGMIFEDKVADPLRAFIWRVAANEVFRITQDGMFQAPALAGVSEAYIGVTAAGLSKRMPDPLDRTLHTGTQAASTITGLATVATSGDYNDLSNLPATLTPVWSSNGTSRYYNGGNVGIGTSAPTSLLHVAGGAITSTIASTSPTAIDFKSSDGASGTIQGIADIDFNFYAGSPAPSSRIRFEEQTTGSSGANIKFATRPTGSAVSLEPIDRVIIKGDGETEFTNNVVVTGDVNVDGIINSDMPDFHTQTTTVDFGGTARKVAAVSSGDGDQLTGNNAPKTISYVPQQLVTQEVVASSIGETSYGYARLDAKRGLANVTATEAHFALDVATGSYASLKVSGYVIDAGGIPEPFLITAAVQGGNITIAGGAPVYGPVIGSWYSTSGGDEGYKLIAPAGATFANSVVEVERVHANGLISLSEKIVFQNTNL